MKPKLYIASKVKHAHMWRMFRDLGWNIISTWIDEAGEGETSDMNDLWRRCISEAVDADALIVYRQPGEILKGAFIELGAALAADNNIYAVGLDEFTVSGHSRILNRRNFDSALGAFAIDFEIERDMPKGTVELIGKLGLRT